jgi:glycosyltransferase involved in cell wall biosynthesis
MPLGWAGGRKPSLHGGTVLAFVGNYPQQIYAFMSVTDLCPVVIITHEFFPKRGGISTFTEEIAQAAANLGHVVEVWAQRAEPAEEKPWPFTVRRMPISGTHNLLCRLKAISWLIRERRRLRHTLVYFPEPGPMLALMTLLPVRSFLPRRLVLTFHGSEVLRFHADPATRWFTRRLIRHAFRISTLTRHVQDLLCQRFPEATAKTVLSPGALRAGFAIPTSRQHNAFRRPNPPAGGSHSRPAASSQRPIAHLESTAGPAPRPRGPHRILDRRQHEQITLRANPSRRPPQFPA